MANRKTVEKLVDDVYAARARGDYEAMANLCGPNATLRIVGDGKLCPIATTTKGRASLRKAFEQLAQFAFTQQKKRSIAVSGNTATVHWRAKVTYKPTGKSALTEFCDLWTVENGKILSVLQFVDTAVVNSLMQQGP
jgi:ketosteroid isomerase-like protein